MRNHGDLKKKYFGRFMQEQFGGVKRMSRQGMK